MISHEAANKHRGITVRLRREKEKERLSRSKLEFVVINGDLNTSAAFDRFRFAIRGIVISPREIYRIYRIMFP